ncbi:MAG: hypothetical protein AABY83_00370 [Pseudomonadota bacterium]
MSSVAELTQRAQKAPVISASTSQAVQHYFDDLVLLGVMPLIAGCGLVYEYALSHYAGIILGNTETAIFIMIGIMIMSAGFGSLMSQRVTNAFAGLVWLEIAIIVLGSSAVPVIAAAVYISNNFLLANSAINSAAPGVEAVVPYLFGFVMGFLMGMEMPLVARIREKVRGAEGAKGTAIVYASDCIGIASGTFVWAAYLGNIDVISAATLAASVNAIALSVFILRYRTQFNFQRAITIALVAAFLVLTLVPTQGAQWFAELTVSARN